MRLLLDFVAIRMQHVAQQHSGESSGMLPFKRVEDHVDPAIKRWSFRNFQLRQGIVGIPSNIDMLIMHQAEKR